MDKDCLDYFRTADFHSTHVTAASINEEQGLPQVAFMGRSNSGKSSLINALLNRKALVKVSSVPGKTKTINLFTVKEKLFLADLPGFGFARVSKTDRKKMFAMIYDYLHNTRQLKMVFVLCDSARALPEEEKELLSFCFLNAIQPVLVWTKTDRLKKDERLELKKENKKTREEFPNLNVVHASSKSGVGIEEIKKIICHVVFQE